MPRLVKGLAIARARVVLALPPSIRRRVPTHVAVVGRAQEEGLGALGAQVLDVRELHRPPHAGQTIHLHRLILEVHALRRVALQDHRLDLGPSRLQHRQDADKKDQHAHGAARPDEAAPAEAHHHVGVAPLRPVVAAEGHEQAQADGHRHSGRRCGQQREGARQVAQLLLQRLRGVLAHLPQRGLDLRHADEVGRQVQADGHDAEDQGQVDHARLQLFHVAVVFAL
mmetsp:Transcript_30437/g.86814  ORF Transcript_30437/g.86814 Transcript_30437/m.86814 type:complete len:226 (+) Transcript_30437:468-1145(+)